MFRIAVHLHIYYFEMWEIVKFYLNNLDQPYHLFVTMISENEELKSKILQFHKDTTFFTVPNKGYDVGPFIFLINKIDLNSYDLIIKIHTKRNYGGCDTLLNKRWINRADWFKLSLSSLLGSKKLFSKNIHALKNDATLGMIGSRYLITSEPCVSKKLKKDVNKVMQKLGYKQTKKIEFVAGTMFIVRSAILRKIAEKYTLDDFEMTNPHIHDGSLAHVMERLFGCVTCAEGYRIKGFDRDYDFEHKSWFKSLKRFLYFEKITTHNYKLIKICKVPVYHKNIVI